MWAFVFALWPTHACMQMLHVSDSLQLHFTTKHDLFNVATLWTYKCGMYKFQFKIAFINKFWAQCLSFTLQKRKLWVRISLYAIYKFCIFGFLVFITARKSIQMVRLLFYAAFTQRPWLYNGAPLVAFYDTLGIRRMYSRLKPPASSRGPYKWNPA